MRPVPSCPALHWPASAVGSSPQMAMAWFRARSIQAPGPPSNDVPWSAGRRSIVYGVQGYVGSRHPPCLRREQPTGLDEHKVRSSLAANVQHGVSSAHDGLSVRRPFPLGLTSVLWGLFYAVGGQPMRAHRQVQHQAAGPFSTTHSYSAALKAASRSRHALLLSACIGARAASRAICAGG